MRVMKTVILNINGEQGTSGKIEVLVCQLFIDFEKTSDSIKSQSLYDILIKFGVPKS